jgi:hypothetical protein
MLLQDRPSEETRDMDREKKIESTEAAPPARDETDATNADDAPNPPRTTTGKMTAPKFGSAGSGGAELEPGPGRD